MSAKDENEDFCEIKEDYILFLPNAVAAVVKESMKSANSINALRIWMNEEKTSCEVYVKDKVLHGKMADMTCVVENNATTPTAIAFDVTSMSKVFVCQEEKFENEDPLNFFSVHTMVKKSPVRRVLPKRKVTVKLAPFFYCQKLTASERKSKQPSPTKQTKKNTRQRKRKSSSS